jgi:hypothetical protein
MTFDSLSPQQRVELLLSGDKEIAEKLRELCVVCGELTASGDLFMVPVDGRWPDYYWNLWRHKACQLPPDFTFVSKEKRWELNHQM